MITTLDPLTTSPEHARAEAFVEVHQRAIWWHLRACGCLAEDASELAQDVFLLALRKDVDQLEPAAARAWLRRAAIAVYGVTLPAPADLERRGGWVCLVESFWKTAYGPCIDRRLETEGGRLRLRIEDASVQGVELR